LNLPDEQAAHTITGFVSDTEEYPNFQTDDKVKPSSGQTCQPEWGNHFTGFGCSQGHAMLLSG